MSENNGMNLLVYALPNTNSGGLSVVTNLYEDVKRHRGLYPDVHWFFIVGTEGFSDTENITIVNESWALKTYFHRWYYNTICVRKFVKENKITAVISLNVLVTGLKTPSIICMHNVLPLYRCNHSVFDKKTDIIKQAVRNMMMVNSWKRADYIIVPSLWIAKALVKRFNIRRANIMINPISILEVSRFADQTKINVMEYREGGKKMFIYPSSGFPYKNHRVIVEASKRLKKQGIENYYIRFTGNVGNERTIRGIRKEISRWNLPIEFCGLLPKEELIKAYKSGVLIFPSKIETDGFPILESMSCGAYIIASNRAYAQEALAGYDNYDLFEPDDSFRLAELMEAAIKGRKKKNEKIDEEESNAMKKNRKQDKTRIEVIIPLARMLAGKVVVEH